MVEITVAGVPETDAVLRDYPTRTQRAMVRAMNRAINSGRTVMVREIAKDTGLKQKDVRDAMRVRLASLASPTASLGTSLKRLPLIKFNARGPNPSRGRGRGVTYRLRGSRGRHPHAFIARMKSGHEGIFARSSKKRLPIHELFGPSLGQVFAKFRPQGVERVQEVFAKNFAHELKFAQAQDGGGLGADTD